MKRHLIAAIAATAVILALAGCAAQTTDPTGTWTGSASTNTPTMILHSSGRVSGTDGCGRLNGSWARNGQTLHFTTLNRTIKTCSGVDQWLGLARSATLSGTTMIVRNAQQARIGTLHRAS